MTTLVIATFNQNKLREVKALCRGLKIRLFSLKAFPHLKPVHENGKTFWENAVKKARDVARKTGLLALADDSGLCVEALRGAPGVRSARFAGRGKDDLANCKKLLNAMEGIPDRKRKAYFHCSIALASPGRLLGVVDGKVHGRIAHELRGRHGFGYDPLFYYLPFRKTFGELPLSVKNKVSHRSRALRKAVKLIRGQV